MFSDVQSTHPTRIEMARPTLNAMFCTMRRCRDNLQIIGTIVQSVFVNVMDVFICRQRTAKLLGRDHPMLIGPFAFSRYFYQIIKESWSNLMQSSRAQYFFMLKARLIKFAASKVSPFIVRLLSEMSRNSSGIAFEAVAVEIEKRRLSAATFAISDFVWVEPHYGVILS